MWTVSGGKPNPYRLPVPASFFAVFLQSGFSISSTAVPAIRLHPVPLWRLNSNYWGLLALFSCLPPSSPWCVNVWCLSIRSSNLRNQQYLPISCNSNYLHNLWFGKWDGARRGCIEWEPCPSDTVKQREGKTHMLVLVWNSKLLIMFMGLLPAAGIGI